MTEQITINDIGTDFQVTITENGSAVDVSAATDVQIILKDPDGNDSVKTAAFVTDGTDGKIHYTTVPGDIDQRGDWSYRGRVTFSPTQVFSSVNPVVFSVIA